MIATKRIYSYDGTNVTFHYNRHKDEKLVVDTVPVLDFIERLIHHIPEKHFKMIHYYGIYARHHKADLKIRRSISKEKHSIYYLLMVGAILYSPPLVTIHLDDLNVVLPWSF